MAIIDVLEERLTAIMDKLGDIHEEVKATNGRVRKLENFRAAQKVITGILGFVAGSATAAIIGHLAKDLLR